MILETLTSPIILFFVLGLFAGFVRSDLAIPEAMAKGLAIYLMAAIGLKGGVSIAATGFTTELALAGLAGIALSFLLPFPVFALLRSIGGLNRTDAAATSAHYGSVSLVTYITASEMLAEAGMEAASFMVAVLAIMETPAIVSGLLLARRGQASPAGGGSGLWHEVLLNASVVLLVGAMVIGFVAGPDGFAPVKPVFDGGYRGILCLFLLDMGLIAARRLMGNKAVTARLAMLAIAIPFVNGILGTVVGTAIGLDVGTAAILGVLAASASYIAVPAAMRLALPEADPGIYLSLSLGITFPFNVVFNIAFLSWFAGVLA
ncbi:sodium-dependent bicarbonate transport family permease [Sphingomonas mesophila]|uniref:sodium-dependent bicarbonate transport family permease n=1 Tax=Sphingomonas mesophila TaxID=2303576 RepID=UPI000E59086B|nr:sodium-dependent bicarbonate transport family permease [Sphingomonas mesophila]